MAKKYPEGSMGASEQKIQTRNAILFSVLTALAAACVFIFPTFLKECAERAGGLWNILGALGFIASAASVWLIDKWNWLTADRARWIWIGGILAGIVLACGFNFNTFGTSQQ